MILANGGSQEVNGDAGMAGEIGYGLSCTDFCSFVVAGKIGSQGDRDQVGRLVGTNRGATYRTQGTAVRQKRKRVMSLRSWLFGGNSLDEKYKLAVSLADEVTDMMRSREMRRDPFKVVLTELFFVTHDPTLVADAFEISQESRIYRGTEH